MSRRLLRALGAAGVALALALPAGAAVSEDEAVEAFVSSSPDVLKARNALEAARIDYERATGVAAAPVLSLSGAAATSSNADRGEDRLGATLSFTWSPLVPVTFGASWTDPVGAWRSSSGGQPESQTSGTRLTASWTLWPAPASLARSLDAQAARLGLEQARHALDAAVDAARSQARRLYVQVQVAARRLQVARQRLLLAQQALDRAVEQRRSGLVGEDAVLEARSAAQQAALAVQQAAASLAGLERQLGLPADRLPPLPEGDELAALARRLFEQAVGPLTAPNEELGLPAAVRPDAMGSEMLESLPSLPAQLLEAVTGRAFEVAHARGQLDLARRRLQAVRQGVLTTQLSATVNLPRIGDRSTWSVSLSVGTDLFDGGKRRLDEEEAASAVAQAEQALKQAQEQVRQELEATWDDVATAVLEAFSARAALDLAEWELASARSRQERGVASAGSVTEAELKRTEAALSVIEAARTLELAWQELVSRMRPAGSTSG